MNALTIELSWPVPELSPNKRLHHMALHRFKKAAREEGFWATRQAIGNAKFHHDGTSDVLLRQVAHPPANYRYDRDGIDARLKAHRDGIADALGVNDRFFRPTGIEWGEPISGGRVVITIGGDV